MTSGWDNSKQLACLIILPNPALCARAGSELQSGPEEAGPTRWSDVDLPALLRCFCAKQQRHYLVSE